MPADIADKNFDPMRPNGFSISPSTHDVLIEVTEAGVLHFGQRIYEALAASGFMIVTKDDWDKQHTVGFRDGYQTRANQ